MTYAQRIVTMVTCDHRPFCGDYITSSDGVEGVDQLVAGLGWEKIEHGADWLHFCPDHRSDAPIGERHRHPELRVVNHVDADERSN
jgi:hypothetical protein